MTPTNTLDDLSLFRQIVDGNESAFETIFHRYTPKLKPFLYGIVKIDSIAEELVQEVFLKLWLNRENLVHVKEPSAWIYRLASNLAFNQLKKQAVEYKNVKQAVALSDQFTEGTFEKLSAKQLQELIHEAIGQLPEKRRQIYLLSREQGLSHKEIAETLQISANTVKNQVISSLKHIQDYILKSSGVYIPFILLSVKINMVMA